MVIITLVEPVKVLLNRVYWQAQFPEVVTRSGFITPTASGQVFKFLTHPGTLMILTALVSYYAYLRFDLFSSIGLRRALEKTVKSGLPASIGIISMVCLAAVMDHTGMTLVLAQSMARLAGTSYPIISPF